MKEAVKIEIKIYQINLDRDHNRVAFANLEHLERYQGAAEIDSAIYPAFSVGSIDLWRWFQCRKRAIPASETAGMVSSPDPGSFFIAQKHLFQEVTP